MRRLLLCIINQEYEDDRTVVKRNTVNWYIVLYTPGKEVHVMDFSVS